MLHRSTRTAPTLDRETATVRRDSEVFPGQRSVRTAWEPDVVLYEIAEAVAHPDHTVTITWSDGARGVVDFLPIIDRGGWFTPLRDGDWFAANMVILDGGIGLTWPEEMDYSADGLRRDAFPDGAPPDGAFNSGCGGPGG
jgi:hypothetical protein